MQQGLNIYCCESIVPLFSSLICSQDHYLKFLTAGLYCGVLS